jgi:hypothetical protein
MASAGDPVAGSLSMSLAAQLNSAMTAAAVEHWAAEAHYAA